MARYMGGPRDRPGPQVPAPPAALPVSGGRETGGIDENQTNTNSQRMREEIPSSGDIGSTSQDDQGGFLQQAQLELESSEMEGDGEVLEGENRDGIADRDDFGSESISSAASYIPLYRYHLREHDEIAEALGEQEPGRKRKRSLSIPIHYPSRFNTKKPIFQPQPLSIAYGWMVKGTAEHLEDLHLCGIPVCNKEVHSKTKIEVLGEYTWIEVTPSQEESYERFPAIYVPGNTRTWRAPKIDTSLDQDDIRSVATERIRDDNLHRQPQYPYEPTFRALESAQQATDFNGVDIVTDADTLTQLLCFIMGPSAARRVKEPFRLELTSVRNTLFIHPSHKPGSSQAGPPPKKVRHDPKVSVPDWATDAFAHIGTRAAKLPYSGGHYRVVRYRLGGVVVAARVKVDFVYEHRKDAARGRADPLRGVQPEFLPRRDGDVARVWRTTVKAQGLGTRPAGAGIASVRYVWQDPKDRMRALLPRLWFSRSPFVVDCQVSYPDLRVKKVAIVNSRQWYPSYERGYQASLRRLSGLLKHLQERTPQMGGNVVLIADPSQVCFVMLKPVINRPALPEELVLKFWGPDTEKEDRERQAEMEGCSTPEQEQSDLTDLSDTPSLPPGSLIANVCPSPQPGMSQGHEDGTSSRIANGSPTRAERQIVEGIDPVKMVKDWNKSVSGPLYQSVDGAGYDGDNDVDVQYSADANFDGHRSPSHDSLMVGEAADEAGNEGVDTVLNSLALQMNAAGQAAQGDDDQMAAVYRRGNVEVLQGQHSLLMVDRHLTAGMHSSDDDGEWPPRPRGQLHGRIHNAVPTMDPGSMPYGPEAHQSSSPLIPVAPTPLGPSDFDEEGRIIDRYRRNRDQMQASSSIESSSPPPRRVPDRSLSFRYSLTASGRARLSEPNAHWRRYFQRETASDDSSRPTSSHEEEEDPEDQTSSRVADDESVQSGVEGSDATDNGGSSPGGRGGGAYDPAHVF